MSADGEYIVAGTDSGNTGNENMLYLWQKNSSSPHLSYFNKLNLTKLFSKNGFTLLESGNLETLEFNNLDRFRNMYKRIMSTIILTIFTSIFFFLQFILPKDIMYLIFKKESKTITK